MKSYYHHLKAFSIAALWLLLSLVVPASLYAKESVGSVLDHAAEPAAAVSAQQLQEKQARLETLVHGLNDRLKERHFVPSSVVGLRDYFSETSFYNNRHSIRVEIKSLNPDGAPDKTYVFNKASQRLKVSVEGQPDVIYSPYANKDAYNTALQSMIGVIASAYNFTSYSPALTASQRSALKSMSDTLVGVLFREFAKVKDFSATVPSSHWNQINQYYLMVEKTGDILKIRHIRTSGYGSPRSNSDVLSLNFDINLKNGDMKYVQIPGHSVSEAGVTLPVFEAWKYIMGPYPDYKGAIYHGIYQTLNYDPTNNANIRRASDILSRIKALLNF